MKTLITITMTEQEYAAYKELQAAIAKTAAEKEAIQNDCGKLAQMVCYALRGILNGAPRIGMRSATLLYDKAEEIIRKYGKQ